MSVGAQLQQARKDRKLSLAEVTNETKIQPWVLEAIESDQLQDLMSPVYVKGFLATYARFLTLTPEPLLAQVRWPQLTPERSGDVQPISAPAIAFRWPSLSWARVRPVLAAGLAILGLVMISVRRPSVAPVARRATGPAVASVSAVSEPLKPPPLPTVAVLATQPLELVVTAHRTTWIQLKADGKLVSEQRLSRGATERWVANKRFELIILKPVQVEVTLNGQSISPLARAHKGRLLITHHGVTQLPSSKN